MKKEIIKLILLMLVFVFGVIITNNSITVKSYNHTSEYKLAKYENISSDAISLQESFVGVVQKLKPTVVNISTTYSYEEPQIEFFFGDPFEDFFNEFFDFPRRRSPQRQKPRSKRYNVQGGGSGVIISEDGYILTNEHVIKDATEVKVLVNQSGQEKEYKAKIIGRDARTDLAIIKINAKGLAYAKLGDSDKVRIGEWVLAIGSPFGLEQTVTSGIVSALRQRLTIEGREYRDFIQTDAAINRGNSGGPLCNIKGEVIGINTAIYAPTGVFAGIGFAIPINRVKQILDDLIHKGKVTRGWLGVEIAPVDNVIAKQFGLTDAKGVLINSVMPNTPAQKAGLKRGDIVLEIEHKNKKVQVNSPSEMQDIISSLAPKEKIVLKILRDKKEQFISVVLSEMPQDLTKLEEGSSLDDQEAKKDERHSWLGHQFINLTSGLRKRLNLSEEIKGVYVVAIDRKAKEFEDIGLREEDVIISVNQRETDNIAKLKNVLKTVDLKEGVVFDIIRDGKPIFISFSK